MDTTTIPDRITALDAELAAYASQAQADINAKRERDRADLDAMANEANRRIGEYQGRLAILRELVGETDATTEAPATEAPASEAPAAPGGVSSDPDDDGA